MATQMQKHCHNYTLYFLRIKLLYFAFARSRDRLNRRCNQERILLMSKTFPERENKGKTDRKTSVLNKITEAVNNTSMSKSDCVPCRWGRGSIVGQPALLTRNLKSFQGIFGHSVGFCLYKNIVWVGGLHDGVMLHHTVDTCRKPRNPVNKIIEEKQQSTRKITVNNFE